MPVARGIDKVSGHPKLRRGVLRALMKRYHLQRGVQVAPQFECRSDLRGLRGKLGQCDFVFIVTGYASHGLTEMILNLSRSGVLKAQVILLNTRGRTGVLREIVSHVAAAHQQMPEKITG